MLPFKKMLYSRLQKMKQLSDELIDKPAISVHPNPTAIQLGFQKELRKSISSVRVAYSYDLTNSPHFC